MKVDRRFLNETSYIFFYWKKYNDVSSACFEEFQLLGGRRVNEAQR